MGRGFRGGDEPLPHTRTTRDLWAQIKPLAREMRKEPTVAEKALWERLRGKQVGELRFRRQHPIDKFIVDFYCAEARLVVEVDGPIHEQQQEYDALRQEFIEGLGIRVIRFANDEVLQHTDGVVERIGEVVAEQLASPPPGAVHPHPPAPSPILREGEKSPLLAQRGGDLGVGIHSPQDLGVGRKTAQDIVNLRILDSACGSGSFLIYAYQVLARFYESEIERLTAERDARVQAMAAHFEQITVDERIEIQRIENEIARLREYPRLILETHLYGVDLDPQAAEIATVNLIMRAMEGRHHEKRLPLILGQSVKVGNSLVGLRPDDPRMQQYRREIAELIGMRRLLTTDPDKDKPQPEVKRDFRFFMTLEEAASIPNPKSREEAVKLVLARMAEPETPPLPSDPAHETYYELEAKTQALREMLNAVLNYGVPTPDPSPLRKEGSKAEEKGEPLDNPGFTIIFGNPPWEIVKPDLREFYAQFDPAIESHLNRAQVEQRIAELNAEDPRRTSLYEAQTQYIEQTAAYVRSSPDYTRQGRGDTATHKLFIERMWTLLQDGGRLGYVVPSGIYTDLGTKDLREMFLNEGNFQYIFSFSNERFFFPGVDHRFKFALIGAQKGPQSDGFWAAFRFNPRVAVSPDDLPAFLTNGDNLIYVRRESLERFSPDSLSLMEFQTRRDYEIAEKIYDGWPLLGEEYPHPPAPSPLRKEGESSPLPENRGGDLGVGSGLWNVRFNREFDFANDRHLLNEQGTGLPFYEGKMIHQYDAFYAPPQYWISEEKVAGLSEAQRQQLRTYRVVHRRIARATDERTVISAIVPPNSACENNATTVLVSGDAQEATKLYVCGLLNSFVLDYLIRYKVATTLNMFYMESLPVPRLTPGDPYFDAIVPRAARLTCTRPEFADLWREVMGSEYPHPPAPSPILREGESSPLLAQRGGDLGVGIGAPATDPAERQRLRDEIDALVAHLYGLSRDEFDHILGTFPLVFPDNDEGRARRAALLAVYHSISP